MKDVVELSVHQDSRIGRFIRTRLYGITDLKEWSEREAFKMEEACRGGVDILQLRSKVMEKQALMDAGFAMREITKRWGVLFIVNDHPDIAAAAEADGVHLGQTDMPIARARSYFDQNDILIGKSTHNVEQAISAEKEGADYIGLGPLFSTPTKPNYGATGLEWIRDVKRKVSIPIVAIGGIDRDRIPVVIKAGVDRVAVVRAIFSKENIYEAVRQLKNEIELNLKPRI